MYYLTCSFRVLHIEGSSTKRANELGEQLMFTLVSFDCGYRDEKEIIFPSYKKNRKLVLFYMLQMVACRHEKNRNHFT